MAKRKQMRISSYPIKDQMILVKMTKEEKQTIIKNATIARMRLGEWLRYAGLQKPRKRIN